ncbi:MAG: division/cell wall cluster transcriptional repressor MraZ [Zetaproteobacteria bacterium]|nr:MAG: division/cell wall cluster transcriptional repressor MraZ [Zetaproteobacteria bacterium]
MALFLSTYTNKVDKKGRVSVPASFRSALADQLHHGIVVFSSNQHSCLEGFDWAKMDEISERMDHYDLFSDDQDDLATTIFGQSVQLFFDSEGRVTLPAELIEAAHLGDRVTFVGLGRKFQIWNPEMFERRKTQARGAVQDRQLTVPKTISGGGA